MNNNIEIMDFEDNNKNKKITKFLELDKRATDIYTLGYKNNSKAGLDYTKGLILQ